MEGSTSPTQEKTPRAPNWTEAKHEKLALSWPAVSKRPEWSKKMLGPAFYEAVATHFNANSSTRRTSDLRKRLCVAASKLLSVFQGRETD
ncbi:hypothetical protein VP01_13918g1 [Puccinia sorghi]|uniref:Uncharacterized protein n=1 Tax=Puccinia sorghi TaxID=27349 RepID=A0A0L6VL56_9BASI|nr:hypothetical protein VP01_13918g1 [Puccinia sorghi]